MNTFSLSDRIVYTQGDSATLPPSALHFEKPLRFLHIDASHQHPYVLKDLISFSPHVPKTGIICLDDINDAEYPGVNSAMVEFCLSSLGSTWRPFAIGANKAYLCHRHLLRSYQSLLLNCGTFGKLSNATVLEVEVLLLHARYPKTVEEVKQQLGLP
jgi:hypothetical protein